MLDYRCADISEIVYVTADPRTGIRPEHLRYRFIHCVQAAVTSALPPETWKKSLDEQLIDHDQGKDLDGYVWGVRWQELYPGMKLVPDPAEARRWTSELGIPFFEVIVAMNAHVLSLVFSGLTVDAGASHRMDADTLGFEELEPARQP